MVAKCHKVHVEAIQAYSFAEGKKASEEKFGFMHEPNLILCRQACGTATFWTTYYSGAPYDSNSG